MTTRANLVQVLQGHMQEDEEDGTVQSTTPSFLPSMPELRVEIGVGGGGGDSLPIGGGASTANIGGPMLYVREDGTVDWEGALQDRAALRKFGNAVWARINGQTPDDLDEDDDGDSTATKSSSNAAAAGGGGGHGSKNNSKSVVIAKIEETAAIMEARAELNRLIADLNDMEKAHTALLATGTCTNECRTIHPHLLAAESLPSNNLILNKN